MGRKKLRELVLETHPHARCVRIGDWPTIGNHVFRVVETGRTIGIGISKLAAWRDAAEKLTAVAS